MIDVKVNNNNCINTYDDAYLNPLLMTGIKNSDRINTFTPANTQHQYRLLRVVFCSMRISFENISLLSQLYSDSRFDLKKLMLIGRCNCKRDIFNYMRSILSQRDRLFLFSSSAFILFLSSFFYRLACPTCT